MFSSSNLSPRARAEFNPQKAAEPAGNDTSSAAQPENLATVEEHDRLFADFAHYARTSLNHSVYSIQWYRRGYQNFRVFLFEGAALPPSAFAVRLHAIEE